MLAPVSRTWKKERKTLFEPTFWVGVLGGSFFWTWLDDFLFRQSASPGAVLAGQFGDHQALISSLGSMAFLVLVFVLSLLRKPPAFIRSTKAVGAFATLGFLGTVATAYMGDSLGEGGLLAARLATGASMGLLTLTWEHVCASEEPKKAMLFISAVGVVSLALNLVSSVLVPDAKDAFMSLLLLGSGATYALFQHRHRTDARVRGSETGVEAPKKQPKRSVLGVDVAFLASIAVFSFAFGIMYGMEVYDLSSASSESGGMTFLVTRGVVALLFLLFFLFSRTEHLESLFRVCLSLMVVGLIAIIASVYLFELLPVSGFLMSAGYATFTILVWTLASFYGKTTATPLVRIIVMGSIVDQAGVLAGSLIGSNLKGYIASPEGAITLLVMSYLLVLSLMNLTRLSMLPWRNPKQGAVSSTPASFDDSFLAAEFRDAYGLTAREVEVLLEFAKGRSTAYIADKDHVSESTVKTHVRHFYTKLDIHNRQELLDLIEKLMETQRPTE